MTVNKHSVDLETEIKEYDNRNKTIIEFLVNNENSDGFSPLIPEK